MKISEDTQWIFCELPHCTMRMRNHKWGKIQGHNAGWYMSKEGEAFCPLHNPVWLAEWRQWRAGVDQVDPPCNRDQKPPRE